MKGEGEGEEGGEEGEEEEGVYGGDAVLYEEGGRYVVARVFGEILQAFLVV